MRRALVPFALILATAIPASSAAFPEEVALPDGFLPEGIAIGNGTTFYAGSRRDGAVWTGDVRTGEIRPLVPGRDGRIAVGLERDERGRLFVAGGSNGEAYVYDARTGGDVAIYELTDASSFVNDVVVTQDAAWFTDSFRPVLYRIPLGPGGRLPEAAQTVPLSGEYEHVDGFNLNGIDATPSGDVLIAVNSTTGALYRIDPRTGVASQVDLGSGSLTNGDGLLLDGRTLYVVQNLKDRIAVVALSPDLSSGTMTGLITDPDFDVPTTIAEHGDRLYAVNARFTTAPEEDTPYWIAKTHKP